VKACACAMTMASSLRSWTWAFDHQNDQMVSPSHVCWSLHPFTDRWLAPTTRRRVLQCDLGANTFRKSLPSELGRLIAGSHTACLKELPLLPVSFFDTPRARHTYARRWKHPSFVAGKTNVAAVDVDGTTRTTMKGEKTRKER